VADANYADAVITAAGTRSASQGFIWRAFMAGDSWWARKSFALAKLVTIYDTRVFAFKEMLAQNFEKTD
jgi:hypothetical protein